MRKSSHDGRTNKHPHGVGADFWTPRLGNGGCCVRRDGRWSVSKHKRHTRKRERLAAKRLLQTDLS